MIDMLPNKVITSCTMAQLLCKLSLCFKYDRYQYTVECTCIYMYMKLVHVRVHVAAVSAIHVHVRTCSTCVLIPPPFMECSLYKSLCYVFSDVQVHVHVDVTVLRACAS